MNSISIILYLANVFDKLGFTFTFLGVFGIFCFLIWMVISISVMDYGMAYKEGIKMAWIPILFFIIASFMPSANTMYLIAGSQISEKLLNPNR